MPNSYAYSKFFRTLLVRLLAHLSSADSRLARRASRAWRLHREPGHRLRSLLVARLLLHSSNSDRHRVRPDLRPRKATESPTAERLAAHKANAEEGLGKEEQKESGQDGGGRAKGDLRRAE